MFYVLRMFAGVPASLSAFAAAFAQAAQVSRHLPWRLRESRKSLGICRGVSADTGEFGRGRLRTPGFRRPGFRRPGFRRPGFRPGLWSTGPTARPGTGERPVGAPDHSQGRNPWCVDDRGETLGGPGTCIRPDGALRCWGLRPVGLLRRVPSGTRPNSPASADAPV